MKRSLRILTRASDDIDGIFEWLDSRSPSGAAAWYEALFKAAEKIVEKPERHPKLDEASSRWNRAIHQALFKTRRGKRYRIVFEFDDSEVLILRVRGPGQPPLRRKDIPTE